MQVCRNLHKVSVTITANVEYLRRTDIEKRSARNQSYIKELKVKIKN